MCVLFSTHYRIIAAKSNHHSGFPFFFKTKIFSCYEFVREGKWKGVNRGTLAGLFCFVLWCERVIEAIFSGIDVNVTVRCCAVAASFLLRLRKPSFGALFRGRLFPAVSTSTIQGKFLVVPSLSLSRKLNFVLQPCSERPLPKRNLVCHDVFLIKPLTVVSSTSFPRFSSDILPVPGENPS